MADVRAIAVCKGGPLDGQHFSVLLDETGSPPPLTSRAEVAGALYLPGNPVDPDDELRARFYGLLQGDKESDEDYQARLAAHDALFGHEAAFEYVPHAFTVDHDENGAVTKLTAGAAL